MPSQGIIVAELHAVNSYIIALTIVGIATMGMAWMPYISQRIRISYSILYLVLGMVIYITLGNLLPLPLPIYKNELTMRLTEMVVIISLMGTGLKIDQPFSVKAWAVPLRLVSITMVLSIAIVAGIAIWLFKFDPASAVLLGAVLAPTDPVLASDVQVGPPMEKTKDNVRFSLTAEGGMNDGTAFPFTWLAILLAGSTSDFSLQHWVGYYLLYKTIAGVLIGFLLGRVIAYVLFRVSAKNKDFAFRDGFVAIAATLLVYGISEMAQGYGFISVFVAAITLRNYEMHHKYHQKMHAFTDQIERIFVAIVLILFGGSLVSGVLDNLSLEMAFFALAFVVVIRPLTALAGIGRPSMHFKERLAISFFGIRGVGSFFYLAFALHEAIFAFNEELWALGSFVVLLSITLHGISASTVMKRLEDQFAKQS